MKCTCPFCGKEYEQDEAVESASHENRTECCTRCGFSWNKRTNSPLKCPKCGSYAWNKPIRRCVCRMCGHEWNSRLDIEPSKCPSCKSVRWNDGSVSAVGNSVDLEKDRENVRAKWVCKKYSEGLGCVRIASETGTPLMKVIDIVREFTNRTSVRP